MRLKIIVSILAFLVIATAGWGGWSQWKLNQTEAVLKSIEKKVPQIKHENIVNKIKFLEEKITGLQKQRQQDKDRIETLQEELSSTKTQLSQIKSKLRNIEHQAKGKIKFLKRELSKVIYINKKIRIRGDSAKSYHLEPGKYYISVYTDDYLKFIWVKKGIRVKPDFQLNVSKEEYGEFWIFWNSKPATVVGLLTLKLHNPGGIIFNPTANVYVRIIKLPQGNL